MEIVRYKYIFVITTLLLSFTNNEELSKKSKPKEISANCPFSKMIEDIFKIHNKSSNSGIYLKDNERAKIFLNSIANITDTENNYSKSNQEKLVNDIIASINRIKNNISSDNTDSKMNEAIILNVPKATNKTSTEKELPAIYKNVGNIKSGIEEKKDAVKSNVSKIPSKIYDSKEISNTTTDKVNFVEILTIEPNNTNVSNISSHNIIEVLKHLMPMFNSTLTKELHNITIIERNHNKNHSYSATKNVSTIVVTYCDKENLTKLNQTFESGKESDFKTDKINEDDDYYEDNDSESDEEDDNSDVTISEKKDILEAAEYGMQKMHELYSVLEPKLYSMGLWLDDTNPARYVAAFNAPSEDSAKFTRYGYATLQAATRLKELTNGGNGEVEGRTEDAQFPSASALRQSPLMQHCPSRGAPKCPPASKRYRTHDGTCNNHHRPRWGSTMTPVQRFLSPSYSDGLQAPRRSIFGSKLPSAREISSMVHESQNVENPGITHLLMQWGQFVDHDVTSSSQSRGFNGSVPRCCKDGGRDFVPTEFLHPECFPISVPSSDPFYGPRGIKCLDFIRSSPAPRDDCALGWREQLNQVSAYIDGSPLYASSARQSDKLRLFRNGMLQYGRVQQRRPILPPERRDELCRGGAVSTECFKSGDARVNEHPGLVAAHIVWLRQHNRMAQELAHLNPHWSDEKIYQETRKIVGAMVQHITYREFLPIVLGTEVMRLFELEPLKKGYYKNYNPKINASPASSFGSAAFRFGHSLVQPSMMRYDRFHRPIHNNVSLHNEQTNPSNIWSMGAVDRLLLGMVNQPIQKRDEFITEELTNHLFQTSHFDFGMDLAAINIQRGRDHGVPSYTMWREPCGLSAILEFEDLFRVMPARAARKLQALYRHVDDIDLFTGGMAERPVVGGLVGPTFACIIAQQFSNLRKGDRFWYENGGFESSFTPAQLQQIRRISFAQVLCNTLDTIDSVQPFVFLSSDNPDNDRISCQNGLLNNFDLSPWVEIDSDSNNDISKSDDEPSTEKPRRTKPTTSKPSTTTLKTTQKKKTAVKVNQRKQAGNSTKFETGIKQKLINDTDTTSTDNTTNITNDTNTTLTVQKIDDKLDFRNKSRRYEDTYRLDTRHRPTKKYNDYNYDYDDDDNVQSVQSVVINNVPQKRPNHRPVITVTENIDKYTYLINYVPRPTVSWRQTTRKTYDRVRDRDVVKVTYQTYDDTYRRPNKPYYYNRREDLTDTDTDNYRRNRPNSYTTVKDFHSSARSNDYTQTTAKIAVTDKPDTRTDSPTTENLYKLVTFGYVGSYRGNEVTIDKTSDKKRDETENDAAKTKHDTDKNHNNSGKTKHDPDTIKHDTDKNNHDLDKPKHDTDETKHGTDITQNDTDKTKHDPHLTKDGTDKTKHDTDKTKHDTISKDFMTDNLKSDRIEIEDKTNIQHKLSTFFFYETATKPYNNLNRPTRRNDDEAVPSYSNTRTKYYYVKNVLHKYPDNDKITTIRPNLQKKNDDTTIRHINKDPVDDTLKENHKNPGQVNIEERSSADKLALLDDIEAKGTPKTSAIQKLRSKIKKPASSAKTPSVAFQVIPSENNPSQWAVYEEDEGLLDEPTHRMPSIKGDPYALKEIPRPMNLGALRRRRPGRF